MHGLPSRPGRLVRGMLHAHPVQRSGWIPLCSKRHFSESSHTGTKEGACLVMFVSKFDLCAVLELLVMFFQACGILGLCLSRLMPRSAWCYRGKIGFIVALFGLGIAGALCGRHDSEFALFAG